MIRTNHSLKENTQNASWLWFELDEPLDYVLLHFTILTTKYPF